MIGTDAIREHLIDRLEPIFGKPKSVDGLAAELAKHTPEHANELALDGLADRIIASRKAKGFPSASELIAAVKSIPAPAGVAAKNGRKFQTQEERNARDRAAEDAEKRAVKLLAGTDLARRAVAERWAPGLIEFTTKNGRTPQADEEGPVIRLSRENDDAAQAAAREAQGPFAAVGRRMATLRREMHEHAARALGFGAERVDNSTATPPPARPVREPHVPPVDPATLTPTDELVDLLGGR